LKNNVSDTLEILQLSYNNICDDCVSMIAAALVSLMMDDYGVTKAGTAHRVVFVVANCGKFEPNLKIYLKIYQCYYYVT